VLADERVNAILAFKVRHSVLVTADLGAVGQATPDEVFETGCDCGSLGDVDSLLSLDIHGLDRTVRGEGFEEVRDCKNHMRSSECRPEGIGIVQIGLDDFDALSS